MKNNSVYKKPLSKRKSKRGYTIIEAAIGVTIATLIGSISYNQFLGQRPDMALNNVAWRLMSELRLARASAIAENTRAVVTFSGNRMTIETDSNTDGSISDTERKFVDIATEGTTMVRSQTSPVAFTGTGRFIINSPEGPLTSETIQLRHAESATTWEITIFSNGQVKLDKPTS